MFDSPRDAFLYGGLGALSLLILLLDWLLPAGLTVELLQVPVILLTLFLSGWQPTVIFGGLTTLWVGAGYAAHLGQGGPFELLANRGLVLAGLWLAVGVVLRYKQVRKARRESEARARAILETTVDGIITIDPEGTIESFNPAAEDIFGYDAEEAIGQNVTSLMPSPYREEFEEHLRSYRETGSKQIVGTGRQVSGKRREGSTFPMELSVSEVDLGERTLFTGVVRDISERRRLEREILTASEEERRRIGQDLHDGLGQMLTGIGLLSQDLARHLDEEGHERADDMAEITEHVKEADRRARTLSHGLVPVDVEPGGLAEALRRLAQNVEQPFDVECSFREIGTVLVHDQTVGTHLYRIAQEAANNAVRHADPDHLWIALAAGDEQIRLRVRDDGRGFEKSTADEGGMGVRIMRYRARLIGGTLEISSAVGEGTVLTCTLPRSISDAEDREAADLS